MKLYLPCAVVLSALSPGGSRKQGCYDNFLTFEEAKQVIDNWESKCGLSIIVSFVNVYDSDSKKIVETIEVTDSGRPMEYWRAASDW